jgi:transcriptional regulator with XRE-family HTH domain
MQERRRRKKPETLEQRFGAAIREHRKSLGLSQEALAFESGYHPTYIGQVERGQKNPSLRAIFGLAKVLRVPPSELLRQIEGCDTA